MAGNTEAFDVPSIGESEFSSLGRELAASVPVVPKDIQVKPDKVLAVAEVVEDQAGALQDRLKQQLGELRIDPPAADTISTHAIRAWNELVADGKDSYAQRVREYVRQLRELGQQLRAASQRYQQDERERADSLGDRHVYQA